MASKLSTLEEKMQHLEDDYQTKKGNLEWSINKLKSDLLEVAKKTTPIPGSVRTGETYGSYFVEIGGFLYGVETRNGHAHGIEEIGIDLVLSRCPDYK
jgi:hypothetical protein